MLLAHHENDVVSYVSERFPNLNLLSLSEEDKDEILARLATKSKKMKYKFASLVGKTMEGLEKNYRTVKDLIVVLEECDTLDRGDNRLIKNLEELIKEGDIKDAFRVLHKYWSYFDYELLSTIINTWCDDLIPRLDEYISAFVNYCELRVCEVPSDSCGRELPKLHGSKKEIVHQD